MSEENPFFTVVLPTYNRAVMLRTAIRSVLAQSCREYECFVLDDGSTDDTPLVFKE
ncbi:MAG: glycosyltransferase, partial [Elusimicrobia bacterium]|nr:glycosyltransferase [Elusimicrobiota bacterium]